MNWGKHPRYSEKSLEDEKGKLRDKKCQGDIPLVKGLGVWKRFGIKSRIGGFSSYIGILDLL